MTDETLTPLQEDERAALCGDRVATLRVVTAVRRLRASAANLLARRYRDGECDAVALHQFASEVESVEESGEDDE